MMKLRPVLIAVALGGGSLNAQTRTRELLKWDQGGTYLSVTASSKGRIEVAVVQGSDHLLIWVEPGKVKRWADSAEKLISASPVAPAGDKLSFSTPQLEDFEGSNVTMRREIGGDGPPLYLYFSDQYVVNTILLPVTNDQARAFLDSLRKGVAAVKEIQE